MDEWNEMPIITGEKRVLSRSDKYIIIILDSQMSWNEHLDKIVEKGQIAVMQCSRAIERTWGIAPNVFHCLCLYTAVIKPRC